MFRNKKPFQMRPETAGVRNFNPFVHECTKGHCSFVKNNLSFQT